MPQMDSRTAGTMLAVGTLQGEPDCGYRWMTWSCITCDRGSVRFLSVAAWAQSLQPPGERSLVSEGGHHNELFVAERLFTGTAKCDQHTGNSNGARSAAPGRASALPPSTARRQAGRNRRAYGRKTPRSTFR